MTEVDPNIALSVKPIQLENPMDIQAKHYQLSQMALQNQQGQQDFQDQQKLRQIYAQNAQNGNDPAALQRSLLAAGPAGFKQAQSMQMAMDTHNTALATQSKDYGQGAKDNMSVAMDRSKALSNVLGDVAKHPDSSIHQAAWDGIDGLVSTGIMDAQAGEQAKQKTIAMDPATLRQYSMDAANQHMDAMQKADLAGKQQEIQQKNAPQYKDTGSALTAIDPNTGQPTGASIAKGVTPGESLSANVSRSNNKANITKDYAIAGLNPDGSPGDANQALVKMIGENRIVPSDRLESTPRGQAILGAVEKQYPGYDRSTAQAKVAAARDFTVGKDAASLRSIGTATKHLDMLDQLVTNLNNTGSPIYNNIANKVASATGSVAPGNFDAAKDIVGKEVIKGIVAGGGGVGEREEASKALSNAKTPAQLRGVIATYKTIMGAQHESLLQQRDAAGLPRSTLPDYTEGAGGGASPGMGNARPPLESFQK